MMQKLLSPYLTWFDLLQASWHSAVASMVTPTLVTLTVLLSSRWLGVETYGRFAVLVAYFGWFSLIAGFATHIALPRLLADHHTSRKEKNAACATTFWLTVALSLLAAVCALLLLSWAPARLGLSSMSKEATLYAVIFALTQFRVTIDAINQSAGRLRQWSASNIAGAVPPVLLLVVLTLCWRHGPLFYYLAALGLASVLSAAFSLSLLVSSLGGWRGMKPDLSRVTTFMAVGSKPWLSNVSNVLLSFGLPSLMAAYRITDREIGFYSIIWALLVWVNGICFAVIIPALSEWSLLAEAKRFDALRRDVRRRQVATGAMSTAAMLLVLVAAEPILGYCYGQDYVAAAPLLRVFALCWPFSGLGCWYAFSLFSMGVPGRIVIPNLMMSVPSVLLSYLSLRYTQLGVMGTVIAYDIGILAWLAAYEWMFRKTINQEINAVTGADAEISVAS